MTVTTRSALFGALCFLQVCRPNASAATVIDSDICVYGGTSGGAAAAVAAARLGKSTALVMFNNHVGGMSSGGLGVTDRGNVNSIGGISREFYVRVGQHYGTNAPVYFFEPHVAEQTFWEMLNGAGVPVYTNQRLASVTMSNLTITQITMEDGTVYRAKEFIDTTYEGDLIALAGVSFTAGREGTNAYNESLAGIRSPGGSYNYDPYVVAGNPASGLLPFVQPGSAGTVGQGDARVQTYNFRLCLTQNATNQIPIAAPTNYSEATYELVARYVEARVAQDGSVQANQLIDIQNIIPNGKTDINANGELSSDYIGYNYTYPTNNYAGREAVRQAHEDYIRGLLHFLATSSRVPINVRTQMQSWQLAKDEFQDTGGWPHQMYVREARRMVSDYVMIQQNTDGRASVPDPIALASYTVDSHPVQRIAVSGVTRTEGGLGSAVPYPYGISYRSIIPQVGECQNVFCTFALSASHVAFASCRMEPVFMMTSQGAATAAAFAIDDQVSAQQVSYPKLSAQLRADGQILAWTSASVSTNGIILDQGGSGTSYTSGWNNGANAGGWNADYWHDGNTGKGTKWVKYTPTLPTNGTYEVYAWWVSDPNRATNTPIDIVHPAGTNRVLVNQRNSSGGWFKLLTTNFIYGTAGSVIIRNDNTPSGYVIADGIRFLPVGGIAVTSSPPPTIEVVASDAVAKEFGTNSGRFSLVRSGDTNPAVVVNYTVNGSASNGVDYAFLPGTLTLSSGATSTNILVTPALDNLVEGDETVILTLALSTNYSLTTLSNAMVVIQDRPVDAWRLANFSPAELPDPSVSGDLADPDQDGYANLTEYALGLPPKNAFSTNQPYARIENGYLTLTYTRSKSATDVSLVVEESNDLLAWQSGPSYVQQVSLVDEVTIQRITVRLAAAADASSAAYLRLKVIKL